MFIRRQIAFIHGIVMTIVLLLFVSCDNNRPQDEYHYAIYFLSNDELIITDVIDEDINTLKLKQDPWLTSDDIDYYDWSSHCIYLKDDKGYLFPDWEEARPLIHMFPSEWADKPFVVVSNGRREYLGYLFSALYSLKLIPVPSFVDLGFNSDCPSNILIFHWPWLYINNTLDNNSVKHSLLDDNLLHEGINITLDSLDTNSILVLDNSDTATISYTITITNNDVNDLYILDPDKAGSLIYHYYNNGVDFFNIDNNENYKSWYKEIYEPPYTEYWSPAWFIEIQSMESITRTITLKGYPKFTPGSYKAEVRFKSPMFMTKEDLNNGDNIYWFGIAISNDFIWRYNN